MDRRRRRFGWLGFVVGSALVVLAGVVWIPSLTRPAHAGPNEPAKDTPTLASDNAIVNPPGAVSVPFGMFNLPGFNWLENVSGQQRAVLWGPFPPAAAPLTVTTFGAWCQNTTGSAQDWDDVQVALATGFSMLGSGSQGAGRVTLEFINQPGGTPYGPPAGSNIQSFLMYQQQ